MKRTAFLGALVLALGLPLIWASTATAADEPANVAGTWEITSGGPRGSRTQTLTIQQDGTAIKGTISGRRGERAFEGTVEGNKLNFTVSIETPNRTFTLEYSGTVDGDSIKGTVHSERFDGEWTGKRKSGGQ